MEHNLLGIVVTVLMLSATIATPIMLLLMLLKQRESAKELSDLKVALIEAFQHLDKPMGDALGESRRNNRLISELLALKQAEMTGDFEIVEEPIAPVPATEPPKLKTKPVGKTGAAKLAPPPQSFPKL